MQDHFLLFIELFAIKRTCYETIIIVNVDRYIIVCINVCISNIIHNASCYGLPNCRINP